MQNAIQTALSEIEKQAEILQTSTDCLNAEKQIKQAGNCVAFLEVFGHSAPTLESLALFRAEAMKAAVILVSIISELPDTKNTNR